MSYQYFKGDQTEIDVESALSPILEALNLQIDAFASGGAAAAPLGDILFDDARSPLANAIARSVFRLAFTEIFEAFVNVGTFEAYLTVFQKIFGDTVSVTFTVPGAGKLNMDIVAEGFQLSNLVARTIVSNAYVFDSIVDYDGGHIQVQTLAGLQSQYEVEQMLHEMIPDGIFSVITLTI